MYQTLETLYHRAMRRKQSELAPLSREAVVQVALEIADAEGLAGVSIRKVAARLDAGPMRLYGYVATKEQLIDQMALQVYAEILSALGPEQSDWRGELRRIAGEIHGAATRHRWFGQAIGSRPPIGEPSFALLERSLAAVGSVPGITTGQTWLFLSTLNAFVYGSASRAATETLTASSQASDKEQQRTGVGPDVVTLLQSGDFPLLHDQLPSLPDTSDAELFETGLELLLDSFAAAES